MDEFVHHGKCIVILCVKLIYKYRVSSHRISAPYIKVYLMDGKNCTEKQKTVVARRTLDPLYQQQLMFAEPYHGKILQVSTVNKSS